MVYSAYYDGVFCLPCVLFGNNVARNSTLLTKLFTEPFTRWNGANTRWKMRETKSPMHKAAFDDMNTLISHSEGKDIPVNINLSSKAKKTIAENKEKLMSWNFCKKNSGQHVSTFQTLVQYISKFSPTMVDN